MVGNILLMIVLVAVLTLGGFLYMDYKTEETKVRMMNKRVGELRRQYQQDCQKD